MSMSDAKSFLERCATDDEFRGNAYQAEGPEGFLGWVKEAGFSFDWHELDDAARVMKLKARDEAEAYFADELRLWYEFMSGGPAQDAGSGSSCGPALCASCGSASFCGAASPGDPSALAGAARPGTLA